MICLHLVQIMLIIEILITLFLLSRTIKLYVPVVTLSTRDNQKLSKLLSKGFERFVYWNDYKTKSENKITTNEYRYFLESNFVGVDRLLVLVYKNEGNDAKRFNARKYYFAKDMIKIIMRSSSKKTF